MEKQKIDARLILRQIAMFSELEELQIDQLAQNCLFLKVKPHDLIVQEGMVLNAFYFVISGSVLIYACTIHGKEKVIEIIKTQQSFGEALMFLNQQSPVNVRALEQTHLLFVPKNAVFSAIEKDKQFAFKMLAALSKRLHAMLCDIQAYTMQSGMERVVHYLLSEVHDFNALNCEVAFQKNRIASRLSMTPEYFSRILHELKSKGLIGIERRSIVVFSAQNLKDSLCNLA